MYAATINEKNDMILKKIKKWYMERFRGRREGKIM